LYDLVGAVLAGTALLFGLGATLSPSVYHLYCPNEEWNSDPVYRYGVWAIETHGWPDATDHSRLTQFNQCYQNPDDDSACARSLSVSEPPTIDLMSFHLPWLTGSARVQRARGNGACTSLSNVKFIRFL
jgi:hypothetical protein